MANKIQYSSQNITDQFIKEIAPHFLEIDDLNLLNTGLFGYINNAMANIAENSYFTTTLLQNETFPNKALLPDSIYAYAALAGFNKFNAVPAQVTFMLMIKIDDLVNMAEKDPNSGMLKYHIDQFSTLNIENNFLYTLDYNIDINIKSIDGKYVFQCIWDMINKYNPLSPIKNPYIKNSLVKVQNTDFIVLILHGIQVERNLTTITVQNNDIVDSTNYNFKYNGDLADFNIYYENEATDEHFLLEKYYVDVFRPTGGRICFYTFDGAGSINIKFSNYPGFFRPEYGSKLNFEAFITKGDQANFEYNNSNTLFRFNNIEDEKKPVHFAYLVGNSNGGVAKKTLQEIKDRTIQEFSIRGNITTENDLQTYFDSKNQINKVLFNKKRDDVITRLYNAFLLLRDQNKEIIPTNSLNLLVYNYQLSNNAYIKPGTLIETYDDNLRIAKIPEETYDMQTILEKDRDHNVYLYTCPFLIRINKKPFYSAYYINSVDYTIGSSFSYINQNNFVEILPRNIRITRNAIYDDNYKITLEVTSPNLELGTGITVHPDLVRIYGIIKDADNPVGYIKFEAVSFNQEDNSVKYQCILNTNDVITPQEMICITDSVYEFSLTSEMSKNEFYIGEKFNLTLNVFIRNDTNINLRYNGIESYIPNLGTDWVLIGSHDLDGYLKLFESMGQLLQSPISIKLMPQSNTDFYYILRMVPLVRYLYMKQISNMSIISSAIMNYKQQMLDMINYLENNFTIDMKFYNTFGKSYYYIINNKAENKLDRVNIDIEFIIRLQTGSSESLPVEINKFIEEYIEETNNIKNDFMYISNLMRSIEENFQDVININFKKINNYPTEIQSIENIFENVYQLTKDELYSFTPEFLNINKKAIVDNYSNISFEKEIKITYI